MTTAFDSKERAERVWDEWMSKRPYESPHPPDRWLALVVAALDEAYAAGMQAGIDVVCTDEEHESLNPDDGSERT